MSRRPSVVLGLSAGVHDAAAALIVDGEIVAAVEEERLTRIKHDAAFPVRAAACCLAVAGVHAREVDLVSYHEKPLLAVGRHLASRLRSGPRATLPLLTRTPAFLQRQLSVGWRIERLFASLGETTPPVWASEHHLSHAAAAFYPSPFERAAILTVDGVGEWASASIGRGDGHLLRLERELRYPDSVGMLYSAFTAYCGFRVNGGEGELMGLAPFGVPRHVDRILGELVEIHDDGSISLDRDHFAFVHGSTTTSRRFHRLFGGPPRPLGSPPGRREADLAASVQAVTEQVVLQMAVQAKRVTGLDAICLAGGVALNCVANGRLAREGPFRDVWVQPAAGDAGNALGAALWAWYEGMGNARPAPETDAMRGSFLGPSFAQDEIERWLAEEGIAHTVLAEGDLDDVVAGRLADGEVVGWFRGAMEFGPRALGHRSILADPRSATVQARLNASVKDRSGFRPFAPAVLASACEAWFEDGRESPFMTFASRVGDLGPAASGADAAPPDTLLAPALGRIPAVTHVDGSARVQTVDERRNPELAGLLSAFERRTGCPVLLNTSFNGHDEPIVCTPADAHRTFARIGLDLLVLERCLVEP